MLIVTNLLHRFGMRPTSLCSLSFIFSLLIFTPFRLEAHHNPQKHLLVLHSYHQGFPWTDAITDGIRQVFPESDDTVELQIEYLDSKRYSDPAYTHHILDTVLHYKLEHHKFDLVIVSDNDALRFALDFRKTLFVDTPIVFCGINNFRQESIAAYVGVTGVAEFPSYQETISYALSFHPSTRRGVVIGNTRNMTGRENREMFSAAASHFEDKVSFEYWDDLPIDELVEMVQTLSNHTVVFINGSIVDRVGRILPDIESASRLREVSHAPLYSFWDSYLTNGIVGGKLVDALLQGETAAQLAHRILDGEDPDGIPVVLEGTNRNMFDFRELQRFAIPINKLPPDSLVMNTPPPFYVLSKGELWGALGVTSLLLLFLCFTLIQRSKVEVARREQESQVRLLLDSTAEAIYGLDLEGNCTFCNRACVEILGYETPDDLLGKKMHPLVHHSKDGETSHSQKECTICRVAEVGEGAHIAGEYFKRADGHIFPVEFWSYPVWKEGTLAGLVVTFLDITDRVEAEEKLTALNRELNAFVYTLSHDLSTPLTAIIGFAEVLSDQYGDQLGEGGLDLLAEIEGQGRRMEAMKDDLLTLAKMGKVPPPDHPVDVAEVLDAVVMEWKSRIVAEGVELVINPLPSIAIPETFLTQIFGNLIGNAIHYGEGKPVEVGGEEVLGSVRYYVRDHGPGIEESERKRVFDVFYRGKTSKVRKGSGIGLATVKKIAGLYGGRTWVEETPGGGSTFIVEFTKHE